MKRATHYRVAPNSSAEALQIDPVKILKLTPFVGAHPSKRHYIACGNIPYAQEVRGSNPLLPARFLVI